MKNINLSVGKGESQELSENESTKVLDQIQEMHVNYGWSDFQLAKVWLCHKTNAIRVRFKHEVIGTMTGIVKPNFVVRQHQPVDEIRNNVDIDYVRLTLPFNALMQNYWGTLQRRES